MYLSRLEIKNFRGIRSANIEFDESTVLIGENDSGKTTLLEAICLVLREIPDSKGLIFSPFDFYRTPGERNGSPADSLRICLTFRERYKNEWTFLRNNELGLHLPDDINKLQELSIEVIAASPPDGEISSGQWAVKIEGRLVAKHASDASILKWIRGLNPVFRINSGLYMQLKDYENSPVTGYEEDILIRAKAASVTDDLRTYYNKLVAGTSENDNENLQAGYEEALKKLEQVANLFIKDSPPLKQIIYDILGRKPVQHHKPAHIMSFQHGSAAEKIGLLLFTTALLHSGSLLADPSAEPILIIEDPEAHLHPMTLQAVKLLIERLRWQKILTTHSGSLLSDFPLQNIRRIMRKEGKVSQYWVRPEDLSKEELRRLSYHVRMRLSSATFARCWLLVEGESEIWLLPHIARLCGYDLAMEGVVCVEFAQCGISPLIKAARHLGIEWFLLADGDAAGKAYIEAAKHYAREANEDPYDRSMRFRETDIEHHLFFNGYAGVYFEYSGIPAHNNQNMQPRRVISRAIHRNSKPFMAVAIVEAMARNGSPGVPPLLKKLIGNCVALAKSVAEK